MVIRLVKKDPKEEKYFSDFENTCGARITIEKDGDISPFSVTFGIYGLMFHSFFCST
jgi:hypothetical protein